MEALTRLVTDSLVRHGFDRPIDPRRLQWSRWYPCNSPKSLLVVPSKPGIFAIAEEIAAYCGASEPRSRNPERSEGSPDFGTAHAGTDALVRPAEQNSAPASTATTSAIETTLNSALLGGAALQRCDSSPNKETASAAEPRRMLAVLQFSEDDDMAFTLDRLFARPSPMRDRLTSGHCFLRFVILEDQAQRRSIASALNQWMLSSTEKATGFNFGFDAYTDRVGRTLLSDSADRIAKPAQAPLQKPNISAALNTGTAENFHSPHPLPSGF